MDLNLILTPLAQLAASRSERQQERSALWDPMHWGASVNHAGHLDFDGVDLPDLVGRFGSPLLAVSRTRLLTDSKSFLAAVRASAPDALVACSYKTNCIPGVLRELHATGLGAEVISPYELWLARQLDVPADRIIVNGVNKDRSYVEEAVRLGVASINVDEPGELALLKDASHRVGRKARVSLRLKVDPRSHFGLRLEDGEAAGVAAAIAADPRHFEFAGLHFHELADNDDPARHVRFARIAMDIAADIRKRFGLATECLNVGGGYTVPTMKVLSRFEYARQRLLGVPPGPPDPGASCDIADYVRQVSDAVADASRKHGLRRPTLLFEPGRILFSRSHVLLTRVHSIKSNARGPAFAMTDAGKILVAYPCDYEYHQIFVANRMRETCHAAYHLMGRLCTAADLLAKNRYLPKVCPGDVLAVMDAGAYFTSYASNFAYPRPEIVMLDSGSATTLRRSETFEHLTAMDVV